MDEALLDSGIMASFDDSGFMTSLHYMAFLLKGCTTFFVWLCSALLMAVSGTVLAVLLYDFISYLTILQKNRILEFLVVEQLNIQLIVPTAVILLSSLAHCCVIMRPNANQDHKPYMFSLQALPTTLFNKAINRWHIIQAIGLVFFIAPVGNTVLVGFVHNQTQEILRGNISLLLLKLELQSDYELDAGKCQVVMIFINLSTILGVWMYGWFTFIIYLNRKKYQHLFEVAASKIVNGNSYTIDACKADITKKWVNLHEYRRLVGWWLCYTLTTGVLGLASLIAWLNSDVEHKKYDDLDIVKFIQITIAYQNIMLVVQSLLAVGSYDVDTIWYQFKDQFQKHYQEAEHQHHLQEILEFLSKTHSRGPWIYTTLSVSIVTIIVAIAFPIQYAHFSIHPSCLKEG